VGDGVEDQRKKREGKGTYRGRKTLRGAGHLGNDDPNGGDGNPPPPRKEQMEKLEGLKGERIGWKERIREC